MRPWSSKIWSGIDDVEVTDEHVNTAIRAMSRHMTGTEGTDAHFETVMLSATVIAYLRALKDRGTKRSMLARIVFDELPVEIQHWVIEAYGFIDPFNDTYEMESRARQQREAEKAERAAASKARREAKRAAEIEAEVQKRLAIAA
jgi:hypothetical protein